MIDSQLTLSAQVNTMCRSGYYQLQQPLPLIRLMTPYAAKTLVQVFISLPGLLQLTVLQHHRRSDEPAAICSECGRTFGPVWCQALDVMTT